MARRYLSVNLSPEQLRFVKLLDEYELDIFTINNIRQSIGKDFRNLNEVLENLVQKEILSRIEQGKYCRHNFRDELVISQYLVSDAIVGYWTALNKHGLTEQFPNTIFVQTSKIKSEKKVFGVTYKFIKVIPRKMIGFEKQGFGNHQYRMSDNEKTIVDCFDLPQYSGGFAELIRAFDQINPDQKKLIKYTKAINNKAAMKRMAFLAVILQKTGMEDFVDFAEKQVNPKYNLFDPFSPEKGEFVSEWKLRLNVSRDEILSICQKEY